MNKPALRLITFSVFVVFAISFLYTGEAQAIVKFRRPLNTILSPVYSAYYDNDSRSGYMKNYYCGTDTVYDGHKGTDFRANVGTYIYAGASGGLYYRFDGCPTYGSLGDDCGFGWGNNVRIDHEGSETDRLGMISVYAHMKQGTVAGTQCLLCGTYIGQTGSSGNSSGPHLHFEIRPNGWGGSKIDPFSGNCSQSTSYWVNQAYGIPTNQCQ